MDNSLHQNVNTIKDTLPNQAEVERLRELVRHYADQCGVGPDELFRIHGI